MQSKYLSLFFILLSLFQLQNSFAKEPVKKLTYEDREQWMSLPQLEVETGGENYQLTILPAEKTDRNERLYLWIGEPEAPNDGDALTIQALTSSGTIWYLDTPEALFEDRSRMTMRKMDGQFMQNLMEKATTLFDEIIVVTADVGSVPVLRGLHLWQDKADDKSRNQLKNVILLYPSLFVNAPTAGEVPDFFPISYQTALPITILQPAQGTQANTIILTEQALKMGGSLVQTQIVPIATDGYFKYQNIRLMAKDAAKRIVKSTVEQIQRVNQIKYKVAKLYPIDVVIPESKIISGLIKIKTKTFMPTIGLKALNGETIKIPDDYRGKALLINFWATWCPHCVEEIPSMNRALNHLDPERFAMISISYKDSKAILKEFVKKVKVDFPILLDSDGKVSEQWNIFAFPSSFLIDANGQIHYSINAGSIWDSPEMIDYLTEVMEVHYQP